MMGVVLFKDLYRGPRETEIYMYRMFQHHALGSHRKRWPKPLIPVNPADHAVDICLGTCRTDELVHGPC